MTDDQLLTAFLTHRDGSAFELLVRRYGPMVFQVCRDVLGDLSDSEDAFQATFLVLVRQAGSLRDRDSLGRWLYEVACRISRRERRRLSKIRAQERQVPEMDASVSPDLDPVDREWKPIIHDEIRQLPSKLRDPIVLCYFEGLTVEDAARRLRCPIGTMKSRLGKGREVLRSRLIRRGLAASAMIFLMISLTDGVSSAQVPGPLLDLTIKAGIEGVSASSRVSSMVLDEEEARTPWSRLTVSWMVLLVALIFLGATRLVIGRSGSADPPLDSAFRSSKPLVPGAGPLVRVSSSIAPSPCADVKKSGWFGQD